MTLGDREPTELEESTGRRSGLISKVLAPAVRLWLRSQVEHVEDLHVEITAGDRQILSGYIEQLEISAKNAIYQGLALNQIQLTGQNIRVNAGQIVRGKPLQLLEPIRIQGSVLLEESDLNTSLKAPLLKAGVTEFLQTLLRSGAAGISSDRDLNLQNLTIQLRSQQVVLGATLVSDSGNETPIAIRTGFALAAPNLLKLVNPQWLPHATAKRGLPLSDLDGYTFNLGDETEIHELAIDPEKVTCQGKLIVLPA
ncbi:LmeA family phospholipid-binding protein [Leptolyngbya sp. AN03gr2]|uniref:LmeA family phospholipid-binding protein n=1 Tax=unclassified Leptolyngbya TaxID=2650499 RepID=UPI003D31AAC5